jgi:hypothetical protein
MGIYDTSSITNTDLNNSITNPSINTQNTEISTYICDWSKWHGMYRTIPELQAVIDKIVMWAAGKGIKAVDPNKQKEIDRIVGFGKDTARDVAINLMKVAIIGGDGFGEIIKNKRGELLNLKPLSPGSLSINSNNKGMLEPYQQVEVKTGADGKPQITPIGEKIEIKNIFHLCRGRIADETHGISTFEKLQDVILKKKDSQDMMQMIFRRLLFPVRIIEIDTDDDTKMAALKAKYQTLIDKGEVMLAPKDTAKLTTEQMQAIIKDSMEWILFLQKYFILSEGVPEVILGSISSKDTEGASKILYLAYEQVVKNLQNWFEEAWKQQIGFEIDLPEPPSIDPLILTDSRKSGSMDASKGNQNMTGKDSINPIGQNK